MKNLLLNISNPVSEQFPFSNARKIGDRCFDADLSAVRLHGDEVKVTAAENDL